MPLVLRPLEGFQSTQSMWQDEPLDEPFELYDEGENPLVLSCSDEMGRNSPALPCSDRWREICWHDCNQGLPQQHQEIQLYPWASSGRSSKQSVLYFWTTTSTRSNARLRVVNPSFLVFYHSSRKNHNLGMGMTAIASSSVNQVLRQYLQTTE